MNTISATGSLVAALRAAVDTRPSPSIADVAGSPGAPGPDFPDPADFTQTYQVEALANTLRANADMQLALVQMFDRPRSPLE